MWKSHPQRQAARADQSHVMGERKPAHSHMGSRSDDLPLGWPDLPANASLSSEVAWVQANRLRVVRESPGAATVVRLDQALSPATSWAALGWLETSVRSYAKFVDVAAKATASDDGDAAVVKRERLAIAEVEALLSDMVAEAKAEVRRMMGEG